MILFKKIFGQSVAVWIVQIIFVLTLFAFKNKTFDLNTTQYIFVFLGISILYVLSLIGQFKFSSKVTSKN